MFSKPLQLGFALASSALLSACYTHLGGAQPAANPAPDYAVDQVIEAIEFSEPDWPQPLHADLYLPQSRDPRPVVIMIHGGGWANRDRSDMDGISEKLARHGYAVFNVSYRFAPRYRYPAQLEDMHQAVGWIARNAERYRLDPERINTWGYSSGAHLAALLASTQPSLNGHGISLPRIRAVVAGGIPSDLRKYDDSPIVGRFLGGFPDEMPQRYADASPAYHISSDDPPVFLYHGKLDFLVRDDQATDYYAALREAGVEAELYLHRWRGHGTMFLFGGDAEDKAIRFLNRYNDQTNS